MNKRTKIAVVSLITILLFPIGVITGVRLLFLPKDGVSQRSPYYATHFSNSLVQSNFEKIKIGWNIDSVERTIGKPFNYDDKHSYSLSEVPFSFSAKYTKYKKNWLINYASFLFIVHYGNDSTVVSTTKTWIYD
ncbi:MAG: hypothetical protein R6U19_09690 [Bacteroidales bacterium]